ncbi:MAG TPA: hypothetical protein PLU24_04305, partial [Candidatus Omnitrophota bacterium]|nr:hypothetical protein [Candidatus Omnitrophota bacterium]
MRRVLSALGYKDKKLNNAYLTYYNWQQKKSNPTNPVLLRNLSAYFNMVLAAEDKKNLERACSFAGDELASEKKVRRLFQLRDNVIPLEMTREISRRAKLEAPNAGGLMALAKKIGVPAGNFRKIVLNKDHLLSDPQIIRKILKYWADLSGFLNNEQRKVMNSDSKKKNKSHETGDLFGVRRKGLSTDYDINTLKMIADDMGYTVEYIRQILNSIAEKTEKLQYLLKNNLILSYKEDGGFFYKMFLYFLVKEGVDARDKQEVIKKLDIFIKLVTDFYINGILTNKAALDGSIKAFCENLGSIGSDPGKYLLMSFKNLELVSDYPEVRAAFFKFFEKLIDSDRIEDSNGTKVVINQWTEFDLIHPNAIKIVLWAYELKKMSIKDITVKQAWALSSFMSNSSANALMKVIEYRDNNPGISITKGLLRSGEAVKINSKALNTINMFVRL